MPLFAVKGMTVWNIQSIDRATVRHWYESRITKELLSNELVLLEMIFTRDGSFQVRLLCIFEVTLFRSYL